MQYRYLLLASLALLSASKSFCQIKVMTFNIRTQYAHDDGAAHYKQRIPYINNIINLEEDFLEKEIPVFTNEDKGMLRSNRKLDFIAFQEDDFSNEIEFSSKYSRVSHVFGLTTLYDPSMWRHINKEEIRFAHDQWGERAIGLSLFENIYSKRQLYIANVHGPTGHIIQENWGAFRDALGNLHAPSIILGDFNRPEPLKPLNLKEFQELKHEYSARFHGFDNKWKGVEFDYIYHSSNLKPLASKVIHYPSQASGDKSNGFASDHFPLLGIFEDIPNQGTPSPRIFWNQEHDCNWALNCDFPGKDLVSVRVEGARCSQKCIEHHECTHFAWTNYEGGTCWLKKGYRSLDEAVYSPKEGSVCGTL